MVDAGMVGGASFIDGPSDSIEACDTVDEDVV